MKSPELLLLVQLLIVISFQPLQSQSLRPPSEVGDDFNDHAIDAAKWTSYVSRDAIGWVAETNGELQIWVSPENTSSNYRFDVTSTWVLHGDFDIQVDYRLRDWWPASGIRIGLKAGGVKRAGYLDSVERLHDQAWGEVYITHFSDGAGGKIPTTDTSGKLRLVRTAETIAGFFHDGADWRLIHEGLAAVEDGPVLLGVWGHERTPGALVAFDNFKVNSGTVVEVSPPPTPPERTRFFTPSFAAPQMVLDFDLSDGDQGVREVNGQTPQSTVWLQLNAVNLPVINGWRILLNYDPKQLRFVPDSFQASAFIPGLTVLATEDEGRLALGGSALTTNASNSAYGTLGTLAFEVLGGFSGQATILATEMVLKTPDGATRKEELLVAVSVSGAQEGTHVAGSSWGQVKAGFR